MGSKFELKQKAYASLICESLVRTAVLMSVAVSLGLAVPVAFADNLSSLAPVNPTQPASAPRFLQAQISHTDAMSRSELSAAATAEQVSLAPPMKPVAAPVVTPNYSAYAQNAQLALQSGALQSNALQTSAQNNAFNLQAAAQNLQAQSDMAADVRKVEYNVDWASWLAKVADRWFFILDQYERSTQQHYVTLRPALFRFTCYNTGQIANITLKQSSGNPTYDRLQMVALIQSMPVPQFPVGTRRQTITLVQGWESHVRQTGESDYVPGSFGRGFPMEKVTEWVKSH
jgi:TonB C terminal